MCGDLDDDLSLDHELFAWLLANARVHGAAPGKAEAAAAAAGEPGSNAYMTALFRGALTGALTDIEAAPDGTRIDAIRAQAIVLARLAGFLAGHLPPESDVFRDLVDALMDGTREPQVAAAEHEHHHDHDHNSDGHGQHGPAHEH